MELTLEHPQTLRKIEGRAIICFQHPSSEQVSLRRGNGKNRREKERQIHVGEFSLYLLRQIKHICVLNYILKNKAKQKQCIGQSTTRFYKESAKMCHKPYTHLHQHWSCECCMRSLTLALGLPLSANSAAQRWPLECSHSRMATKQCWGCSLPNHQGKLHSFTGSHSVSGILAASQSNPFCSWTFLSSMPDHSSVTEQLYF